MTLTRTDIPGFAWKSGGRAGVHRVNPTPLRFDWYPTPIFRTRCGFDITASWRTFHDLPPGAQICSHCERSHKAEERRQAILAKPRGQWTATDMTILEPGDGQ